MIEKFISDLRSIPSEEYKKFFDRAIKVALRHPLNEGIDCFARGETIEWAFIEIFSKYIKIKASEKKLVNDPDGVYMDKHLWDVKTKKEGFLPLKSNKHKFNTKCWDFKKTQTGVDEFTTKSEWYVLIDPWTYRLAVLDANKLTSRKIKENKSRITFSISTEDVIMIYDGIDEEKELSISSEKNSLYKMIWETA